MNTIRQLFLLCFGRLSPVELPYSIEWCILLFFLNFLNHLTFFWSQTSLWQASGMSILTLLSEGFSLYSLLWFRGQKNRFIKLGLALLGTHLMLSALFQLLLSLPWGSLGTGLMFFCSIWALAVNSHIFCQGLEVSKIKAVFIAIGFECLATILIMPYIGGVLS